ncbi:hypothetical protein FRC10_001598 [Ceratobasidium sp. 414]|nr:hypothetical protein FRC10_001598 [Ceratobasidium sp. 414]
MANSPDRRGRQNQARAREEYKKLGADLNDLFHVLARQFEEVDPASGTLDSIGKFARSIDEETKLLQSDEDSESNDDEGAAQDVDEVLRYYRRIRTVLALFARDHVLQNARLQLLSHPPEGHYRASGLKDQQRTGCITNTRAGVLQDLKEWVHYGKFQKVYWLNGIAGTGKTTIAYSFCEDLENSGKPAANFFCSRGLPECRDVKRIFPSLSYQLARLSRPFRCAVSSALEQGPEVCNQPIDEQFKRVIAVPLQNVGHTFDGDVVVVIDALEECEDKDGVNQILDACFEDSCGLPVRFLITSRQNSGIWARMRASQVGPWRAELRLHEVDNTVARRDIRVYLRAKLEHRELSGDDLECLVQRSGGWFLYAASVVSYIDQDHSSNWVGRLKRLLDISSFTETTVNQDIDTLYTNILEETVQQTEVILLLRAALSAQEAITMNTAADLLSLDFGRLVRTALRPLLPVLHVSNAGELGMSLHASFSSYLVDPQRSGKFYCDIQRDDGLLAQLCFATICGASPPFNVCNLETSYLLDREVPEIDGRAKESISRALWYASRHWATHLGLSGCSDTILTALDNFLSTRLLLWMEVMNLSHYISEASKLLHGVHIWLQDVECPDVTRELVLDAWKFVEAFSSTVVSESTPHIYVSALCFWPVQRPVSRHYLQMLRRAVNAIGARIEMRGEGANVFNGSVTRVVRSSQILENVAGTAGNNLDSLRVGTGQLAGQPLVGHTYRVLSVAYSPDCAYIASGSGDYTVRIWDANTGQPVGQPLHGHTSGVNTVAYSPDGAYIASGSEDKTIRIWDAHAGQPVGQPFEGHTRTVNSVAYSPDGAYIASGSDDKTVRIWDVHTGEPVGQPLNGHTSWVFSVAYSPDGAYIASGSDDKAIRIWDAHTGKPAGQSLKGHAGVVRSVVYSPDGAYIVSGSSDETVRIWDAHTVRPLGQPLKGHIGWVMSVAYSPDGTCIVSGSYGGAVRIWDAHTGKPVGRPLEGHRGGVFSVAYSPNGAYITSGSYDNTLRVWDSRAGHAVQPPQTLFQATGSNAHPLKHSRFPSALVRRVTRTPKKPTPTTNSAYTLTRTYSNL